MFLSRNKKNNAYPCKPQFYYIQVGFKRVIYVCFHDGQKTYIRSCAPSEDSDQPAHLHSLIRIFTGCILESQRFKVSSHRERRSDCANVQADLSISLAHMSEDTISDVAARI